MENIIVWFEIPVSILDRAVKFYTDVMGVEFHQLEDEKSKMAFFPFEQGAASGALVLSEGYVPSEPPGRVEAAGGKVTLPKKSIGENGNIAHFEDTEGNRVAFHSMS